MIRNPFSSFRAWPKAAAAATLVAAGVFATASVHAQTTFYGIGGTDNGNGPNPASYSLFSFSSATPGTTTTIGTVTPTAGYALESIAFQPGTLNLYGFQFNSSTNKGQLVTINRTSGALSAVGTAFTIGSISGTAGDSATISFNISTGAVRLVTGTYGNYRINPTTGALLGQDASVAYAAGDPYANNTFQISSIAHNGSTLYDVDYTNGSLATQNTSTGALTTIGSLGLTPTQGAPSVGFTIANGTGFMNTTTDAQGGAVQDQLYSVNLATGAATSLGLIGSSTFNTVDIAAASATAVPEPTTYLASAFGVLLLAYAVRRRRHAARA